MPEAPEPNPVATVLLRPDAAELYSELRAISLRSAERLQGHECLTDDDLYDENGLPA